uniref:Candidate secreted effector n=1 Tax=Meloidogyne incognita TaxID=6306 RepID=A0A914LZD3_MELIC
MATRLEFLMKFAKETEGIGCEYSLISSVFRCRSCMELSLLSAPLKSSCRRNTPGSSLSNIIKISCAYFSLMFNCCALFCSKFFFLQFRICSHTAFFIIPSQIENAKIVGVEPSKAPSSRWNFSMSEGLKCCLQLNEGEQL